MKKNRYEIDYDLSQKRLLSQKEVEHYLGLGRTKVRDYCERIGAVSNVGKRVMYDKAIIDRHLDKESAPEPEPVTAAAAT